MIPKRALLTADNLNSAFISKSDTNNQSIASNLTISGGQISLKNSFLTDNANSSYLRIDPQGNKVIIYDGVNNQEFNVFSSSGSEAVRITTINGSPSYSLIDVTSAVNHLELMTDSRKPIQIGGKIGFGTSSPKADIHITDNAGGAYPAWIGNAHTKGIFIEKGTDNAFFGIRSRDGAGTANSYDTVIYFGDDIDDDLIIESQDAGEIARFTGDGYARFARKITASGGVDIPGNNALAFSSYGGGFYMTDTTWIRTYGNKSFYQNTGTLRTDGTLQVGNNGATFNAPSGGDVSFHGGKVVVKSNGQIAMSTSKSQDTGIDIDGVKFDTVTSGGNIAIRGLNQLRFGSSTSWDWNQWAGIKYDSAASKLYIGGPASSVFSSNASPPSIQVLFDGVQRVGIGTTAPRELLEVGGNIAIPNGSNIWIGNNADSGDRLRLHHSGAHAYIDYGSGNAYIRRGTTNFITLTSDGKMGVGTSSPTQTVDIAGTLTVSGLIYSPASNAAAYQIGDDVQLWDINTANTVGIYGVQNSAVGAIKLGSTGPTLYGSGNSLGINTTTPNSAFALDINGDVRIGSNRGIYSGYNNNYIFKDHGNGNVTISAAGGQLYLGYQNTTLVRLDKDLYTNNGSTKVIDASGKLYYQGNDTDSRYLRLTGGTISGDITTTGTLTLGTGTVTVFTSQTDGSVRVSNTNGYIDIAPKNTSTAHIYTDRTSFYFNKDLLVNGNKVWHAGNDGSGSGLDADRLDGQDSSYYTDIPARLGYTPVNKAGDTMTGALTIDGGAGVLSLKPGSKDHVYIQFYADTQISTARSGYIGYGSEGTNVLTIANEFSNANINLVTNGSGIVTINGNKVWHQANDGSGSGLDADLLDGQDSSYYTNIPARLGYTPVNKAGDTITGNLTMDSASAERRVAWNIGLSNTVGFFGNATTKNVGLYDWANNRHVWYYNASGNELRIAAGSFTYNGNKVWHAGNDGSGSGLDADLLDGLHASQFLRSDTSSTTTGNITINKYQPALIFNAGRVSTSQIYWDADIANDYGMKFNVGGKDVMTLKSNGELTISPDQSSSYKVWHAGNDGAGSGLDADMIDGVQLSSLVRSDTSSNYTLSPFKIRGNSSGNANAAYVGFYESDNTTRKGYVGDGSSSDSHIRLYADIGDVILSPGSDRFKFPRTGDPTVDGNEIWHAGNDGSGSGLDADKLDGLQASQFMRSDADATNSSKLILTGKPANLGAGWHGVIEINNGTYGMIWNRAANIGFGMHTDGHFYWAKNLTGSPSYLMQLRNSGYLYIRGSYEGGGYEVLAKDLNIIMSTSAPSTASGYYYHDIWIQY